MPRHVEVLSTVSGGSIIAALYILHLKREIDTSVGGNLDQTEYMTSSHGLRQPSHK